MGREHERRRGARCAQGGWVWVGWVGRVWCEEDKCGLYHTLYRGRRREGGNRSIRPKEG